jgi:hydrolase
LTKLLRDRDLDISHVLLTHWHGDHTEGVPDLISYNPEFASRIYKNQPDRGQQTIEDGQFFRTEDATVRAVFTPGHAVDHMCFVLEEENALFTGDNVLGHGYSVSEDLGAYTNSLDYMDDQHCAVGYPAHGIKIEDLPRKIKHYIRHKKTRERQIFSVLVRTKAKVVNAGQSGKGSLTTRELVYSLHGDVSDDMFEMALEPFTTEVLWKLAEDRKVGFELVKGKRRWFLNERTWKLESLKH